MPVQTQSLFDSGHQDQIHDCQLDYYGRRLATCSSDRVIKIFEVTADSRAHLADLTGHEGPVWQVSWAHPKFGHLLASCSFDRKVIIWKEMSENQWRPIFTAALEASVNSVAWAPHEIGLVLAAGSSDGAITVISHSSASGQWETAKIEKAHLLGVTSVSWSPPTPPGSLVTAGSGAQLVKCFVSGGCDNTVKIWRYDESRSQWAPEHQLAGHQDWVRDVAWAPNLGMPSNTIASAGQDGKVLIWTQQDLNGPWQSKVLADFKVAVWRVSWSVFGNILAVSDGNNAVTLWKEATDGEWVQIQRSEAAPVA